MGGGEIMKSTGVFATADEARQPVFDFNVTTQVFPSAATPELRVGPREGGFGEVKRFLGERKTSPRTTATKIPQVLKRFKAGFMSSLSSLSREAYASRLLNEHPNIVKCLDMFILEEAVPIPPEKTTPLTTRMANAPVALVFPSACVSLKDFWKGHGIQSVTSVSGVCQLAESHPRSMLVPAILYQILRGLAYCHGAGIVHRDIKPDNLLVFTETKQALPLIQIADFGQALLFHANNPHVLYSTNVTSPYYKAPELIRAQLAGHMFASYSSAVDMWAVGITFYQLLFPGEYPFDIKKFNFLPDVKKFYADLYRNMEQKYFEGDGLKEKYHLHIVEKLIKKRHMARQEAETTARLLTAFLTPNSVKRIGAKSALQQGYFRLHKKVVTEVDRLYPVIPTTPPHVSACGLGWLLLHQSLPLYSETLTEPTEVAQEFHARSWILLSLISAFELAHDTLNFSATVAIFDDTVKGTSLKTLDVRSMNSFACAALYLVSKLQDDFLAGTPLPSPREVARFAGIPLEGLARIIALILQGTRCNTNLVTIARFLDQYIYRAVSDAPSRTLLHLMTVLTLLHPQLRFSYQPSQLATGILYLVERIRGACLPGCMSVLRPELEQKDSRLKPAFTFPKNLLAALVSVQDVVITWPVFPEAYQSAAHRLKEFYEDRRTHTEIPTESEGACVPTYLRLPRLVQVTRIPSTLSPRLASFWKSSESGLTTLLGKRKR